MCCRDRRHHRDDRHRDRDRDRDRDRERDRDRDRDSRHRWVWQGGVDLVAWEHGLLTLFEHTAYLA